MFSLWKNKKELHIVQEKEIKPNIEIKIESESDTPLFENEEESIREGAQSLLENKRVDSLEEGIIFFATVIRGLAYKETKKTEDGKTIIILKEKVYEKTL